MVLLSRFPSSGRLIGSSISRYRRRVIHTSYFSSGGDLEEEDPKKRIVELEFEVDYSEDEITIINQCIQVLQEWKEELAEPNLTGREPRISKNWERLPHHESNSTGSSSDSSSVSTLGG